MHVVVNENVSAMTRVYHHLYATVAFSNERFTLVVCNSLVSYDGNYDAVPCTTPKPSSICTQKNKNMCQKTVAIAMSMITLSKIW